MFGMETSDFVLFLHFDVFLGFSRWVSCGISGTSLVGYLFRVQGDGAGTWISPNPGSQEGSGVQGRLLQILIVPPRHDYWVPQACAGYLGQSPKSCPLCMQGLGWLFPPAHFGYPWAHLTFMKTSNSQINSSNLCPLCQAYFL